MYKKPILLICFVLVLGIVLSSTAEAADPDLLVWYKFDEVAGTTAFDSSNFGNDGVLMGDPQWTAVAQYGGALDFDGDGDYVEDADGENYLNGQIAFTVSAWVKSRQINTDRGFLIGLQPTGGDRSVTMRYDSAGATFGGDDVLKVAVSSSDLPDADGQQLESSEGLQTTDWQHYLMTWSSGGLIRFYVNGVEDTPTGRSNANTGGTSSENTTFIVGRGGKDASAGWDGLIDDVRIYKRVLTQGEIEDVRDGKGGREAGNPAPAHLAVDVPVDADLTWVRGDGTNSDEVYFGTDPGALPLVADITVLPIFPPLYDPGDPNLIASTTYYWEIVEVNGIDRFPSGVWEFTTVRGEAQPDYPSVGAMITGDGGDSPWTKLIFVPGPTSVEYKGYFSEDYSKVLSRHADANLGPPPYDYVSGWEYTYFAGNVTVPPIDEPLVRGTRYYWTVDSNDALGNTFAGDIWEFAIQGYYAFAPSPPNEAILISTDVLLSWLPGFGVADHDIYMGTSWEDVNNAEYDAFNPPPEFVISRSDPNYQASGLPADTKLYWRVDQVNGREPPLFLIDPNKFYKGDVWCFETIPYFPITDPNLVGWWKFDTGLLTTALDWSGYGNDGTIFGAAWTSPGPIGSDYCMGFDGTDDYIAIQDLSYSGTGYAEATVCGWIRTTNGGDQVIASYDRNEFWRLEINGNAAGTGQIGWDVMTDTGQVDHGSVTRVDDGQWHHVAGVFDNGTIIIYIDGKPEPSTTGGTTFGSSATRYGFLGVGSEASGFDGNKGPANYFDGYMDDVRIYDCALSQTDIRKLAAPAEAWIPSPYDGESSVPVTTPLQWMPGKHAALHDVYFGTDKAAVTNATVTTAGIYKGRIGPNTLSVPLVAAELYYWRVDEVNDFGPEPYMWKGDTWTFRTVGGAGGLLGLYYHWDGYQPDNPVGPPNPFQILMLSRIDPTVDFPRSDNYWATTADSPDPNVNVDFFACRWVGHVECPVDANYTFTTECDDGARLFIDGQDILPPGTWSQGGMRLYSGNIMLSAGMHDIEMHMYERDGGAGARLRWSAIPTNPSDDAISQQIIPPIWLWPPLYASGPRPPDGATIDDRMPMLEWIAGIDAEYHELYFSEDFDDVNDRNPAVRQITGDPCYPYPAIPPLRLGRTYYWLVDEVKSSPPAGRWDARTVWSFTISECFSLDNMEDYNDRGDVRQVWRDGNADVVWGGSYPYLSLVQGGSNGSNLNVSTAVGSPTGGTGPVPPTPLNDEAMALYYDNDGWTYQALPGQEKWVYDAPNYSEIEANTVGDNSLAVGQTWDSEGVKALTLSFQGHPISDGTYDPALWPVYTQYGRGRDIQGRHDEFYFFSKYPFIGEGSIQAHVFSVENTNSWAKAGVMIREKWTPYSKYAAVFMTPGQGVTFQYRMDEDGPTTDITKPGVFAPQYVRLVRNISGAFEAKHSDNSYGPWQDVNAPNTEPDFPEILMGTIDDPNIYAGTAVTSHNANQRCAADFNDMRIDPLPTNWIRGNIGTNDPEQLYVALSDGTNTEVVEHDDANAATLTTWQEWNIELSDFTTVNLDGIQKVYIGFGDRAAPVYGGSGAIYVDDIRACPPRCVPAFAQMAGDIATPYDCTVDEKDIRVLAGDWLLEDDFITSVVPASPIVQYLFEGNYFDSMGMYHGTPMGGASIITDSDRGQVLTLDGDGDYVDLGNPTDPCALDFGTGNWTVCAWVKTTMSGTAEVDKGVIYGKGGDHGGGHRYGLYVNENQDTQGRVTLITDDNATKVMIDGSVINDGEWYHLVGMRDGDDLRLYVDGMPDGENTLPAGYDLSGTHQHNAYIGVITNNGADPNGTVLEKYLRGSVDDVRVYGYALLEGEVAYLATDGGAGIHLPINSPADLYKGEAPGNQWINFKDYSLIADQYLEKLLWPTP